MKPQEKFQKIGLNQSSFFCQKRTTPLSPVINHRLKVFFKIIREYVGKKCQELDEEHFGFRVGLGTRETFSITVQLQKNEELDRNVYRL